jgi:DNA primase
MQIDPVVLQFVQVYGVRNLIESIGLEKIRQVGQYYMARCPFHDNFREPDFQIHKNLGLFNCFGCQAKGNLYQFVALVYNLTYKEADKFIQKLAGFDASVNIEDIKFRAQLANMFNGDSTPEAVKKIRKFKESDIARMNTGSDPTNYLQGRGFSPEVIEYFECTYTDKWAYWNTDTNAYAYQKRVVIPGHYVDGVIAGFIGRTIENAEPKYKYTAGYPKSTSIFNLHRAKKHCSRGLILVEGSLDAMNIHQFGFPNVGAIYGATLHEKQIELVCEYTDKLFLMFDDDKAGKRAMLQGIEAFKDKVDLNIIPLSKFKDPGSIPNAEIFKQLFNQSLNYRAFDISNTLTKVMRYKF